MSRVISKVLTEKAQAPAAVYVPHIVLWPTAYHKSGKPAGAVCQLYLNTCRARMLVYGKFTRQLIWDDLKSISDDWKDHPKKKPHWVVTRNPHWFERSGVEVRLVAALMN